MNVALLTVLGLVIATAVAAHARMRRTIRDHTTRIADLETTARPRPVPTPRRPAPEPVTEPIPIGPDTQPIAQVIGRDWERRQNAWLEEQVTVIRERTERRRTEAQT